MGITIFILTILFSGAAVGGVFLWRKMYDDCHDAFLASMGTWLYSVIVGLAILLGTGVVQIKDADTENECGFNSCQCAQVEGD